LQSFSFRYNWSFRLIKYIVIHLDILGETQILDDLFTQSLNNSFVSAVAIPYGDLVAIVLDRDNNSAYFMFIGKLLANDSENQIFPESVCEPLLHSECPSATILICLILPHRLDSFHKLNNVIGWVYIYHLEIWTDWELVGPLKELVNLPKFFSLKDDIDLVAYSWEFSYSFNFVFPSGVWSCLWSSPLVASINPKDKFVLEQLILLVFVLNDGWVYHAI
jgi:hypothetical protein